MEYLQPIPKEATRDIKALIGYVEKERVVFIKLFFTDPFGKFQSWRIPVSKFTEEGVNGFFDGSSIRGWQGIEESDMLAVPDITTAFNDPFSQYRTIGVICNIMDPLKNQPYSRDPRQVAKAAEECLKKSGIGDVAYFGPEHEFFTFDEVAFSPEKGTILLKCRESAISKKEDNGKYPVVYPIRAKQAYFAGPGQEAYDDIRAEMVLAMITAGLDVDKDTHEVAPGQHEIGTRHDSLTRAADKAMLHRYVVKEVARRHGLYATFMPKPLLTDNGNGMHVHMSIWSGKQNLFAGQHYAGLNELALSALEGLLRHAPALLAITNPTVNSYRRLVPGFEAPTNLVFSARNRSAAGRIPIFHGDAEARFEFRCPDASSNPYLTFSALLMAMMDGIQQKMPPRKPLEKDIFHGLTEEERASIKSTPGSLKEALQNLKVDNEFLTRNGVFSNSLLAALQAKAEADIAFVESPAVNNSNPDLLRLAREFYLYFFD